MENHPSFYALDAVALGAGDPAVLTHLKNCQTCTRHLASLEHKVATPSWVNERAATVSAQTFQLRWGLGLACAVGVALLAVLALPRPAEVNIKGFVSVALFVKHGNSVTQWDGRQPVSAGDSLRLKVSHEGYSAAAVFEGEQLLFQGAVPPDGLLPVSWQVDSAAAPVTLDVVVSRNALGPAELREAATATRRDESVWTAHLVIPR